MLDFMKSFNQGWYLTTLLSILCALGTFIIFLDDIYDLLFPRWFTRRFPFQLKENYLFMNGSLAFSSGCLLFTALYRLLPEAMENLIPTDDSSDVSQKEINTVLITSFVAGIAACYIFNQILHLITAESVVHCSHDGEDKIETLPYSELVSRRDSHDHGHSHGHTDLEEQHDTHSHSHGHHEVSQADVSELGPATAEELESAPLLGHRKSQGLLHYFAQTEQDDQLLGECKGYTSAELCLHDHGKTKPHFCEIPTIRKNEGEESLALALGQSEEDHHHDQHVHHHNHHHDHEHEHNHNHSLSFARSALEVHSQHGRSEHHHHHVNSPLSRLMLIGVQTILAITLHKFPEGFITYITSETDPELGVSIFLSLLIHNFTEGFSMCLPLYYSFASGKARWAKVKAVSISAILGGLSQPLGALGGFIFLRANHAGNSEIDIDKLNFIFGITMAITSGFLSVIALSMYGSAVSFSGSPNFVMIWCIIGMCIIGGLSLILASD